MVMKTVYQKYRATTAGVGDDKHCLYASAGPRAEGVTTNNQSGQDQGLFSYIVWGDLDKSQPPY